MAEPEIFDQAIVYVRGALFVDSTSIAITYEDADKPIFLLDGTFIISPGERIMRVAIDTAIAKGSAMHDMVDRYLKIESFPFAIELMGSGLRLTSTGYMSAPGYSFAVGQNSSFRAGLVGVPAPFQ